MYVYKCIYCHSILYVSCLSFTFDPELLHVRDGPQSRGGRSHSPSAPQRTTSAQTATTSAPSAEGRKVEKQSHDNQVDSWEDIDDSIPTHPLPVSGPPSRSVTSPQVTMETKTDSRSTASSSGQSSHKSQEPTRTKEASSSSSASASSTPDLAKLERKQPSPSLSDRGSSAVSRGEGGTSKGNKHNQAPPPKDESTKENINIVFIGHVGEFV